MLAMCCASAGASTSMIAPHAQIQSCAFQLHATAAIMQAHQDHCKCVLTLVQETIMSSRMQQLGQK